MRFGETLREYLNDAGFDVGVREKLCRKVIVGPVMLGGRPHARGHLKPVALPKPPQALKRPNENTRPRALDRLFNFGVVLILGYRREADDVLRRSSKLKW